MTSICLCQQASTAAEEPAASPSPLLLCQVCIKHGLSQLHAARQQALEAWNRARQDCQATFARKNNRQEWSQTVFEIQELRNRLEILRRESGERALKLAQGAVQLEERQAEFHQRHQQLLAQRESLTKLTQSMIQQSLVTSIQDSETEARRLRLLWAVQALELYRLQVDNVEESNNNNNKPRQAKGIGKIGGLPLPHAGLELFGVLPPAELQSALRLVASVIQTAAQCLAIPLPHPILLNPPSAKQEGGGIIMTDIASLAERQTLSSLPPPKPKEERTTITTAGGIAASTTSLVASWMMGSSNKNSSSSTSATTAQQQRQQAPPAPPSLEVAQVQKRIHHARAAVLAEDDSGPSSTASQYALLATTGDTNQFGIAWQLLQNDLITLCIRAGVPVDELWPAEAVLLNLHALYKHLKAQSSMAE